jgi:hypothetical protein
MEENNEYGNCWEDLVRRIDKENQFADHIIGQWEKEDLGHDDKEDSDTKGGMEQSGVMEGGRVHREGS